MPQLKIDIVELAEPESQRLQFDLATPQGKLIATLMAGLAEFERDLLRERVRSGVKAAKARGVVFGRRLGQRVKSDKLAPKVLALVAVWDNLIAKSADSLI